MFDIENRVYTRVKKLVTDKLKTKYPKITFTDSDKIPAKVNYPYIVIHEMESQEVGQDLDNTTINAILSNFEITCYSDTSQDTNKEVMAEVVKSMKTMRFNVVGMPFNDNSDNYRRVARFRRIIGNGDIL